MSGPNFMTIHPTVVEIFHSKPQMSTSWWQQSQGFTKVSRLYPLGTTDVCKKLTGNSDSC